MEKLKSLMLATALTLPSACGEGSSRKRDIESLLNEIDANEVCESVLRQVQEVATHGSGYGAKFDTVSNKLNKVTEANNCENTTSIRVIPCVNTWDKGTCEIPTGRKVQIRFSVDCGSYKIWGDSANCRTENWRVGLF